MAGSHIVTKEGKMDNCSYHKMPNDELVKRLNVSEDRIKSDVQAILKRIS